jgi:hypothetical protein
MVETADLWIEIPLPADAAWVVAYRMVVQERRAVVAEVRIFPDEPDIPDRETGSWHGEWLGGRAKVPSGGLSTRALRSIRIGHDVRSLDQVIDQVNKNPIFKHLLNPQSGWLGVVGLTEAIVTTRPRSAVSGRGRPGLPRSAYAAMAAAYVAAIKRNSRQPVKDVAEKFNVSVSRARARIHTARRLGLMDRGSQGCAGGNLTAAGRLLIRRTKPREGRK